MSEHDPAGSVARLLRADDATLVGTCFCVSADGAFFGARHYLHSNAVTDPAALAIETADGTRHAVTGWDLDAGGDIVRFTTGPVGVAALATEPGVAPDDGTALIVAGYGLDRPTDLRRLEGTVSGHDDMFVEPDIRFRGFYVDCDAADGMSGSPAVSPATGRVVAVLSGINPDWGIAAFCPLS